MLRPRTFKLTTEERNRIYCCLLECEVCKAKRGEFCKGANGREWKQSHHYRRSPFGKYAKWRRIELMMAYNKLCQQIYDSHEVVGHE